MAGPYEPQPDPTAAPPPPPAAPLPPPADDLGLSRPVFVSNNTDPRSVDAKALDPNTPVDAGAAPAPAEV
jgi:hypothetical protein